MTLEADDVTRIDMVGVPIDHEDATRTFVQHSENKLSETWPKRDWIDYPTRPELWMSQNISQ